MNKALKRAIDHAGGVRSLASALGLLPQHINNWKSRGVPANRVIAIEEATGGAVSRYELLPEVFGTNNKKHDH